jgi:uncharacterized membrane protein
VVRGPTGVADEMSSEPPSIGERLYVIGAVLMLAFVVVPGIWRGSLLDRIVYGAALGVLALVVTVLAFSRLRRWRNGR